MYVQYILVCTVSLSYVHVTVAAHSLKTGIAAQKTVGGVKIVILI